MFCSAHEQMADGRIFVAGGHNGGAHIGLPTGNAFDPSNDTWTVLPNMSNPRWYPTVTTLPDGRELVLSGETSCPGCEVLIPEIYNPSTNSWTKLTTASHYFDYYPHVFTLPSGKVFVAASTEHPNASQVLDLATNTWTAVGGPAIEGGSSAMYLPGKILKSGKTVDPDETAVPSVALAYVIDTSQPTPIWRQVQSMAFPRAYHTLTLLPDGTVLATGGGPTTAPTNVSQGILPVEVWNPTTETWTTLASLNVGRLYHSAALLLPDGRVVVLSGGRFDDNFVPTDQYNAEFFSPPYLFKGTRPLITSAPTTVAFGAALHRPDAGRGTHRQRGAAALRQRDPLDQHGPALRPAELHRRSRLAHRHRAGERQHRHQGQLHALPGGHQRRALDRGPGPAVEGLRGEPHPPRAAELAHPPDRVEHREHLERQEGAGDQAAEHRGGDAPHDLRAGALRPEQRQERGGHRGDGHELGPQPADRPLGVRLDDVLPRPEPSLGTRRWKASSM